MTRPLWPLPDQAVRRPLSVADVRALGLTRAELAGPLWQRAARGLRAWHALDLTDPDVRTAVVAAGQPPGTVVGGWAALRRHGVELDGRGGPGAETLLPVLLHVGPAGRTRPTPLLDVDRGRLDPCAVTERAGLLVTTPTAACLAIARRYGAEEGLVAADAAAAAGLTSTEQLQADAARLGRARGVPHARLVAHLVDARAASPAESRLRYVWVVEAGLPRPLVNVTVLGRGGFFVGKPDLLDPEAGAVGEYDGAQHRGLAHHTADNAREEALERLNLVVARATAIDLWTRRRLLVARLRDAHLRGISRDRSRDAWTWHW